MSLLRSTTTDKPDPRILAGVKHDGASWARTRVNQDVLDSLDVWYLSLELSGRADVFTIDDFLEGVSLEESDAARFRRTFRPDWPFNDVYARSFVRGAVEHTRLVKMAPLSADPLPEGDELRDLRKRLSEALTALAESERTREKQIYAMLEMSRQTNSSNGGR